MKRILKIEFVLIFFVIVIMLLLLMLQYNWSKNTIEHETKNIIELKINLIEDELNKWILKNINSIEETCKFIENIPFAKDKIMDFMKLQMKENESFYSVYYGSAENEMINGSGWIPPEGFDLRERPWYKKAVEKEETILTGVFINASNDDIIVTFASPVKNEKAEIIGVVGGDVSLLDIIEKIENSDFSSNGFLIIINDLKQIIAHSDIPLKVSELNLISPPKEYAEELSNIVNNKYETSLIEINISEYNGYFSYEKVENSNWFVVGFIPEDEYFFSVNQITAVFITGLFVFIITFIGFLFLQSRYIFRPIVKLNESITRIDIELNQYEKLPVEKKDVLYKVKWTLNKILIKTETYLKELKMNKETLERKNNYLKQSIEKLEKVEKEKDEAYKHLKRNFDIFINSYSKIVEMRDPYTSGHQHKTAELSVEIGKRIGLAEEELEGLKIAAILHDIGKLHIPTEILNKAFKLTKLEYEMIKEHPLKAYELLSDIEFNQPVKETILQHHEKVDGSGYPKGLKGDKIIIQAKILCISDVYDAMTSHRPYRPAIEKEKVLEYIKENSGILFDEKVTQACLNAFEEGFEFENNEK